MTSPTSARARMPAPPSAERADDASSPRRPSSQPAGSLPGPPKPKAPRSQLQQKRGRLWGGGVVRATGRACCKCSRRNRQRHATATTCATACWARQARRHVPKERFARQCIVVPICSQQHTKTVQASLPRHSPANARHENATKKNGTTEPGWPGAGQRPRETTARDTPPPGPGCLQLRLSRRKAVCRDGRQGRRGGHPPKVVPPSCQIPSRAN